MLGEKIESKRFLFATTMVRNIMSGLAKCSLEYIISEEPLTNGDDR